MRLHTGLEEGRTKVLSLFIFATIIEVDNLARLELPVRMYDYFPIQFHFSSKLFNGRFLNENTCGTARHFSATPRRISAQLILAYPTIIFIRPTLGGGRGAVD